MMPGPNDDATGEWADSGESEIATYGNGLIAIACRYDKLSFKLVIILGLSKC